MTDRAISRVPITGGSSGIGLTAALRLSRPRGARIVVNGGAAAPRAADASHKPSVIGLMTQAQDRLGGSIGALVDSAVGDFVPALFHETSLEAIGAAIHEWRAAPLGLPEPDEVAAIIEFLVGPDAARMTGQVISVNGGISAG